MPCGWTGKFLAVDLTAGEISVRESMGYARDYIVGRALASRIAWDEIPSGTDAYGPDNRIIIATGPLTGTLAPTSGRTIMASVSPRTYPRPWYTHSTLGGWFGPALKYAGYDAIVLYGRAPSPVYLDIQDDQVRLVDATGLWGRDARRVQLLLKERLGEEAQVLTIGPAGENLVRFATVQHAEENAAAHSGFGAVWGAKKLKAVCVRGSGGVHVADGDALLQEVQRIGAFKVTPSPGNLSTPEARRRRRPICSQACVFNCQVNNYARTGDGRLVPSVCIGAAWTGALMGETEYSGGGLYVPPGTHFDSQVEVGLHQLCNSLGLDMWFRVVMQPWFIRCRQLGIDDIRGFAIEPEDACWFGGFMHQLAHRQGLGGLFADDLPRAMDELEGELPEELVRLGRELAFDFGFPAHREGRLWDEEPLPFWVISAMMHASEGRDPTIGAHQSSLLLAGFMLADREAALRQFRRLSEEVWGYPDALEPTFDNKAPVAIWSQNQHMLIDSLPLCDFAFPQLVRPMDDPDEWRTTQEFVGDLDADLRLLNAVTGCAFTRDDLDRIAERAAALERALLAREGRGRKMEQETLAPHFQLPCRADGTLIEEMGFSRLLDEYYAARGWDLEWGWPTPELLHRLGLEEVNAELRALRQATGSSC